MPKNKTPKIKTVWDLKLLYKNEKDPHIEKDMKKLEEALEKFAKKYQNNHRYLQDEKILEQALKDWEITLNKASDRPILYFHYLKDIQAENSYAESQMNLLSDRLAKASNKILFFDLNLSKIEDKKKRQFLLSSRLKRYHYYLKLIFDNAKYNLSESEEKILNFEHLPARSMWISGQEKLLNIQTVPYKNKKIPIFEALSLSKTLPTPERRKLYNSINAQLKSISFFAESEINAIYTQKKILDELRGFKEPWQATFLNYQSDEKSILNLIETVTEHFHLSHRFYLLKKKLLKEKFLQYADREAPVGKNKRQFPFDQTVQITLSAFRKIDEWYANTLQNFLKNGQIDVFPRKGKTGGAYCSHSSNNPTFVLLNHTNNYRNVITLAHEMGHAFHGEKSKSQPIIYEHYVIPVAETASTLFENFVFEEIFETLTQKEKIIALHDRISDAVSTVFRQIACFNFEKELHQKIRSKGALSKEEMASIHNKHMSSYLGLSVKMQEEDGYSFVQWSHIRHFFYVYSYAFGQLISKALYKRYKKDRNFIAQIEKFLSAGGSKSPVDIFKDIGIDISRPSFFKEGLKSIEDDIKRLEKLAKEAKLI
jgi:oligoendopeptidase F